MKPSNLVSSVIGAASGLGTLTILTVGQVTDVWRMLVISTVVAAVALAVMIAARWQAEQEEKARP
jgi:hypothetical protein